MAGLMTVPMIAGLFGLHTVSGRFITATGRLEGVAGRRKSW